MVKLVLKTQALTYRILEKTILSNITIEIKSGEIVALVGRKGAGKTSLIKILNGEIPNQDFTGKITINNKDLNFRKKQDAKQEGLFIISTKSDLMPNLTVAENIFFERQFTGSFGKINWHKLYAETKRLLDQYHIEQIKPTDLIEDLTLYQKLAVEILKAISLKAKVFLFDEITTSLNQNDIELLLKLIQKLKDEMFCILYTAYKLDEIKKMAEKIVILCDGKMVGQEDLISELSDEQIVERMIGKDERCPLISEAFLFKFKITDREKEIINLILKGFSNQEIGDQLFISLGTVKNHIYKVFQKTHVKSRMELSHLIEEFKRVHS